MHQQYLNYNYFLRQMLLIINLKICTLYHMHLNYNF